MAATYPQALKVFNVFHDFSDVIWAYSVNEIHDEIVAIEQLLGTNPLQGTPYTTFGGAISDLYTNKAPIDHTHNHSNLLDDTVSDDHTQYIRVDGTRGFTGPVQGVAGSNAADLVPWSQLAAMGYQNSAQVNWAVESALGNLMVGAWGGTPLFGPNPPTPSWKITGGSFAGCTDGNGRIVIPLGNPFSQQIQAFVCTKIPPFAPTGGFPCPPYSWIEAQVTLVGTNWSPQQAIVQFSHDYSFQAHMYVNLTWIAIGF